MLDPITIATITAAVSVLGNEYLKGIASEAGKATWQKVKALLGWTSDPEMAEVPERVAKKLHQSPEIAQELREILKSNSETGAAAAIVGKIKAEKVIVAQTIMGNITQQ